MKIAICSDVHLEFGNVNITNDENADVLVLAGDVCVIRKFVSHGNKAFFEQCAKEFKDVIYIMGNHEYYHGDIADITLIREHLSDLKNIHILDAEHVKIGDVTFFGGTMWTNMNKGCPISKMTAKRSMNDFRFIALNGGAFSPDDSMDIHDKFINTLMDMPKEKTVVVSHHCPSKKSCHSKYGNTPLNYAFYSDLDFISEMEHVTMWIHGHTHDDFDYMMGSTRVVCNPRGYIGYEERADSFTMKYVEV